MEVVQTQYSTFETSLYLCNSREVFASVCELKLWNTLSDAPKQRPRITLLKKWLKNMIFVKHKDVCISLYICITIGMLVGF